LAVRTEYPNEGAVAPMSQSEKGMTTLWLRSSPSSQRDRFPAGIDGQVGQQLVEEGLATSPKGSLDRANEAVKPTRGSSGFAVALDGGLNTVAIFLRPL